MSDFAAFLDDVGKWKRRQGSYWPDEGASDAASSLLAAEKCFRESDDEAALSHLVDAIVDYCQYVAMFDFGEPLLDAVRRRFAERTAK